MGQWLLLLLVLLVLVANEFHVERIRVRDVHEEEKPEHRDPPLPIALESIVSVRDMALIARVDAPHLEVVLVDNVETIIVSYLLEFWKW